MSQSVGPDTWGRVLRRSERINWELDDVLTEDTRFDFTLPFLPERLTAANTVSFCGPSGRLGLGQIRAHGYLGFFGIAEEMILPFVVDYARTSSLSQLEPVRALLRFASEEAKHIALFRRFRRCFEHDFPIRCPLIGPAQDFTRSVLAHSALGVALAILHIEWMTQQHWLDCVRDDTTLEPAFKRMLRFHWMEEAQHARLDGMLVSQLALEANAEARQRAIDDYLAIVGLLDNALRQQVELDLQSFQELLQCPLNEVRANMFRRTQHASQRYCFLLSGMCHPRFVESARQISDRAPQRIALAARELQRASSLDDAPPQGEIQGRLATS